MTCTELKTQLAPYLSGALSDADCERLEAHAASCAACEALLEQATARPVTTFAPPLPTALRRQTLSAVTARRRARRSTRWLGATGMVAAAMFAVFILRPREKQAQLITADSTTVAARALSVDSSSLAESRAQSEFTALDAAARELESALSQTPSDPQLSLFLASVRARRSELERRVKDARS